jgi:hypothetical protein
VEPRETGEEISWMLHARVLRALSGRSAYAYKSQARARARERIGARGRGESKEWEKE